jgi:hypothetical protein
LSFSRLGVPQISGFHHDLLNAVEKSGMFEFANKIIEKGGFYTADLFHQGQFVKSISFFPAHWPREKVIEAIGEVYDNFIKSGEIAELLSNGKYRIVGALQNGIKIEMYITKKGKITSAYPLLA